MRWEKFGARQFDAQNEIEPVTRKAETSIYWTNTGTRMEPDGTGWNRMEPDGDPDESRMKGAHA